LAVVKERIEGKYEILGKIGEGGMRAVHKVRHQIPDVKSRPPQIEGRSAAAECFLRKRRWGSGCATQTSLCYNFAVDAEGTGFIVMEFFDAGRF
jgi:hypothetical protein